LLVVGGFVFAGALDGGDGGDGGDAVKCREGAAVKVPPHFAVKVP
jgi:hypothetical protein